MDLKLEGKRALVSASTAGIGYATALALAQEGAHVVVNGRTRPRVDEALERIRAFAMNADVSGVAADLSTPEGIFKLVAEAPEVDVLVNNLGIFEPKTFQQIEDQDWFRLFEVNVMSGVRLSRHYLPTMRRKNWGRIVFISSESALQIPAEMIHYGVTKTAQLALSRGIAETTVGTGVTCNCVVPGPTRSEGVEKFIEELARAAGDHPSVIEEHFFRTVRPTSLLRRFALPSEVAALVAFVASPRASAINGAALRVDGGTVRFIA